MKPLLIFSLNGTILNENDTINLYSDQNVTYLACSSINSKPEVSLSIYDTKTHYLFYLKTEVF